MFCKLSQSHLSNSTMTKNPHRHIWSSLLCLLETDSGANHRCACVCGCMNVYVYPHMQKQIRSPIIYVKTGEHKRNESCVLGDSGRFGNSLDFCQASLKSLGCFYFRCVLSLQWKAVTVNLRISRCQLSRHFWRPVVMMCLAISNNLLLML